MFWLITAGGADRLIVCWILIICTCVKVLKEKLPHYKKIFKIRKVILDASLGGYRLNLLKDECRGLGLDYIDISPKGSYRILL